jgi:hypothetical protein
MMIDKNQIRLIHTLKNALGLTEEEYRSRIIEKHGFSGTSKDLSYEEAEQLIKAWEKEATEKGVWKPYTKALKYEDLRDRGITWATPAQCRLVEGMFREISYYKHNDKAFKHAFRNFLFRIAHVGEIRFLEKKDVQKVVNALKKMKAQRGQSPSGAAESPVYRDRSINW